MEGDGWYSDTVSSMGIEEISLTVQGDIKKRQVDGPVKGYTDGITLVVEGDNRVAYLVSNWEPVNSETPKWRSRPCSQFSCSRKLQGWPAQREAYRYCQLS